MKKYFLLGVLALAGLLFSCSKDDSAEVLQSELDRVTLSATLPADFVQAKQAPTLTRALPAAPTDHKLRCVLEVWTKDATPVLKFRDEKTNLTGDNIVFEFSIEQGTYDCLFWADYIATSETGTVVNTPNNYTHFTDKYYTTNATNGLKAVSVIQKAYADGFNSTTRDAFFGTYELVKEAASVKNPTIPALTRPLAKLTIKEKNADNYDLCTGLTAKYKVPTEFNVQTGAVGASTAEVTCSEFINNTSTLEMFTDYILTDANSTLGEIAMTFTASTGNFQALTIPAGIPLQRNYRTNASGTLLTQEPVATDDVTLTVDINGDWTSDTEHGIISVWDGTTKTQPAGYNATTPGTVNITSAAELAWMADQTTQVQTFEGYTLNLTTDIDLANYEWLPIGSEFLNPFKGTFNGNNHNIINLKCTNRNASGLFGYINGSTVKNIIVSGSLSYTGTLNYRLGGITANMSNSTISGCTNKCTITATKEGEGGSGEIGGIVGYVNQTNVGSTNSTLSDNVNLGTISIDNPNESTYYIGGIAGMVSVTQNVQVIFLGNTYNNGVPADVCIGYCSIWSTNGTITVDGNNVTKDKPYPVPVP